MAAVVKSDVSDEASNTQLLSQGLLLKRTLPSMRLGLSQAEM